MSNLDRASAYLRAIEAGTQMQGGFFAPDLVQVEHPNRLVPKGATRDLAALEAAAARGIKAVDHQKYEITNSVEQGDRVALEVTWTATLLVPLGALAAGETMRAHFGVFLTFRDGLIVSQTNYDCFDAF